MDKLISRIGIVNEEFETFNLKSVLIKNDAGDWGDEPQSDAIGIIRSTNFRNNGKLNLKKVAYRSLRPHKQVEKKVFEGDILIERSGGSDVQPVGRVGYVNKDIAKVDFAFANFIQRISVDESIDPKFLHYCLQQMYEMGITETMQNQTTGIRNLDWKQYIKSEFPKPPKPEQTAIANILSKVDEAIEITEKSIKAAEKVKKAFMQNLLTGKLKPDGSVRNDEEFYIDEKFGKVPKGWLVSKLKDLSDEIIMGQSPSSESYNDTEKGLPFVQGNADFKNKKINIRTYTNDPKKISLKNDILLTVRAPVGDIYKNTLEKIAIGRGISAISIIDKSLNSFVSYLLKWDKKQFLKLEQGTTFTEIGKREVRNLLFIVPQNSERALIVSKLDLLTNEIEQKQTKIKTLLRLKKSLMQNLLTGKVRVNISKLERV
jgi:type I restriction enzyme S subunit